MVEYFENEAISQSKLKLLMGNPKAFITVEEPEAYFEEKTHFIIGSGVDCMLTQPLEEFQRIYHISNLENKPTATIKSIVNEVFDVVKEQFEVSEIGAISDLYYKPIILQACINQEYQVRWLDDTRINKIIEASDYWEDLKMAYGKQVLSHEEHTLISSIVMSIKTNEATAPYFIESNDVIIMYQLPIYFEFEEVSCKALLDMIRINLSSKTIEPIDLKTLGDYTLNFPKSMRMRRYDIQGAFYTEALKHWKEQNPEYRDFEILPFKFIVESTIDVGTPLVYTCDPSLLDVGKNGIEILFLSGEDKDANKVYYGKMREVLGFTQLIDLYKYHLQYGFEKSKIVNENNSELSLDWSGIT